MIIGYYKNYLYTTDKVSSKKEKKKYKESQYMVSHPETGSDSPIGSDRDWGRDTNDRKSREKELSLSLSLKLDPTPTVDFSFVLEQKFISSFVLYI